MSVALLGNKREIGCLSYASVGDEIEFFYYGHGEHAFNTRKVRVIEVHDDGVLGEDLTFGGIKKFLNREAREEFVLDKQKASVSEVSFTDARQELVDKGLVAPSIVNVFTMEQLAHVYGEQIATNAKVTANVDTGNLEISRQTVFNGVVDLNGKTLEFTYDSDKKEFYVDGEYQDWVEIAAGIAGLTN